MIFKHLFSGFRLQCEQCDYKCIDHTGLRLHRQSVHENIKYPCKECNYVGSKAKVRSSSIFIIDIELIVDNLTGEKL